LLAWAAMIVGLVSYGLRALGALPGNLFSIYGLQIGSGLGMILLSVALAHRIVMREKTQPNADASAATQRPERAVDSSVVVQLEELNQLNRKLQNEIAERRRAEDALFEMAHHDALTGLPNRLLLSDRFQIAAAQAKRSGRELALLMLDLDDFKQVNDTLGHNVGDALLVNVAEVIQKSVRAADTVARFGGDEYVVLLGNMIDSDEAAHVAEKIIKSLSEVKKIRRHDVRVAPSIGIALYPQDGLDMTALLKCADIAMYRAKQAGGNNYYFFMERKQRQLSLPVMQRE
ncbi:MAG: diguanylate cyclase domain-containing protein, partial [Burkholderiales bacterium]